MSPFRIAVSFFDKRQIKALKDAGASELYCGFVDAQADALWPQELYLINRRSKGANFESYNDIKEAFAEAHRLGMPVYVAFNGNYTEEQYPWILKSIDAISVLDGFTGLIVADIGLLLALSQRNYTKAICISTGGTVFNNQTIDFYQSLNAHRVVLDRQLTVKEIKQIVNRQNCSLDFEMFIFHSGCLFVDGFCSLLHCMDAGESVAVNKKVQLVRRYFVGSDYYGGCQQIHAALKSKAYTVKSKMQKTKYIKQLQYKNINYPYGCNLCRLYDLKDSGNITLKIVGRGESRIATVNAVAHAISLLSKGHISRTEYVRQSKEIFFHLAHKKCTDFNCYCPETIV
ncbi:MAG: U32 family peptidase [Elusimicrobia bacterium]|nr:U32 family peptidase [Elusimicrobiota bacterium]